MENRDVSKDQNSYNEENNLKVNTKKNSSKKKNIAIDYNKRKKSAWFHFRRLYLKNTEHHSKTLKERQSDASIAWKNLNRKERKLYYDKYEEYLTHHEKIYAKRLQKAVPFLKKKEFKKSTQVIQSNDIAQNEVPNNHELENNNISIAENSEFSFSHNETTEVNQSSLQQASCENISGDSNASVAEDPTNDSSVVIKTEGPKVEPLIEIKCDPEPLRIDEDSSAECNSRNVDQIEHYVQSEKEYLTDKLVEPHPPTVINGMELFQLINKNKEVTWASLSRTDKRRHHTAVRKVKSAYLSSFLKYLESLSSEELFNYYINSNLT